MTTSPETVEAAPSTAPGQPPTVACPECGATCPDTPDAVTWCDACSWNLNGGAPLPAPSRSWLARGIRRMNGRAAERLHERLAADSESFRSHPSRTAALGLSVAVLVAAVMGAAGLVWLAWQPPGWWKLLSVALAGLVLWVMVPRSATPETDHLVERSESPALHALVADLAERVGVPPPDTIRVNTDVNLSVGSDVTLRRHTLTIGLPLWACQPWEERIADLGHELGHLRGRDTVTIRIVGTAHAVLFNVVLVMWPLPADHAGEGENAIITSISNVGQRVLALPFLGLLLLLVRLRSSSGQHDEYLADRVSAHLAGSMAMSTSLARDITTDRVIVPARAAVQRREDPWAALSDVGPPSPREVERLRRLAEVIGHRMDASHPPIHLRMDLLEAHPVAGSLTEVPEKARAAVEDEMAMWQARLTRQFSDDLIL